MLQYVRKSDAIAQANKMSDKYLKKALQEIDALPKHPVKKKNYVTSLYLWASVNSSFLLYKSSFFVNIYR